MFVSFWIKNEHIRRQEGEGEGKITALALINSLSAHNEMPTALSKVWSHLHH